MGNERERRILHAIQSSLGATAVVNHPIGEALVRLTCAAEMLVRYKGTDCFAMMILESALDDAVTLSEGGELPDLVDLIGGEDR